MQAPTSRYSDGLEKLKTDKFNVINEQEDFVSNIRQILLSVDKYSNICSSYTTHNENCFCQWPMFIRVMEMKWPNIV